jgi:hypothetical protein
MGIEAHNEDNEKVNEKLCPASLDVKGTEPNHFSRCCGRWHKSPCFLRAFVMEEVLIFVLIGSRTSRTDASLHHECLVVLHFCLNLQRSGDLKRIGLMRALCYDAHLLEDTKL